MTVRDMLADVYDDLNHSQTPTSDVEARMQRLMNRAYQTILREPGVSSLRASLNPLTFASESGRAIYGLPSSLVRVRAITERDSDRKLDEISLDEIRARDPGLNSSGTPWAYAPLGRRVIYRPPGSAALWVKSSSALDTTQAIHVAGIREGGLEAPETSASLNGTTAVQIGTLADYVDVTSIALQQACVGVVSIEVTGGTPIASIGVGKTSPKYLCVQLYPTPTAIVTFYVDGDQTLPVLDGMNDVPLLPDEFHDLIPTLTRMFEHENKGDTLRYQIAKRHYDLGLSRLKTFVAQDGGVVIGGPNTSQYSRAGAMFPAESWD